MSRIQALIRDWLPPIAVRILRHMYGNSIQFGQSYTSWEKATAKCGDYSAEHILVKVLDATLKVKRGEAAFERDSVLFDKTEYVWPVLSGLMWAAARDFGKIDVLDFGGALGSSYFQHQRFLKPLPSVRWSIIEQKHYTEVGKTHIQEGPLRFYTSPEECRLENHPNTILLSSVLQYLPNPLEVIKQLSSIGASVLIIDRTPFSNHEADKIIIQKVPRTIYPASYPMWVFSEQNFREALSANWSLVSSHICPEGKVKSSSGLDFTFQGMLFESRR